MHLLLIRHGETEHNVAGLLVGVTDSRLTNHGFLQAKRLGEALASKRGLNFTHIFASTLQRAWITAGEIQKHQSVQNKGEKVPEIVQIDLLKEQDFGSFEMMSWSEKRAKAAIDPKTKDPDEPGFKPRETPESIKTRANKFVDDCLLPLLNTETEENEDVVAIVSHGLFLQQLWKAIFIRFAPESVSVGPDAILPIPGQSIGDIKKWGNTGYLECTIRPGTLTMVDAKIADATPTTGSPVDFFAGKGLKVLAVNESDHVADMKRDGVGSSPYDFKQQSIKGFFKKRKTDELFLESPEEKTKDKAASE